MIQAYPQRRVPPRRNPGPDWSYAFMRQMDRLPDRVVTLLLGFGTWIAVFVMPRQRAFSRVYLGVMFGRQPRWTEVWRHFFTYTQAMMARIRAAERGVHRCTPQESFEAFQKAPEIWTARAPIISECSPR